MFIITNSPPDMLKLRLEVDVVSMIRKLIIKVYIWLTERLYDSLAWAYDFIAWFVSFGYWSQWRLDALTYLQPGNVLEVGYGTGSLMIEMTRLGYDVFGIEPSPQMQRVVSRKIKKKGLHVNRARAQAEAIPLAGGSFQNVILTFPSNYILMNRTLSEIRRVLHPDGRVVIIGLGVRFSSFFKRILTGWFLYDERQLFIEQFLRNVRAEGFAPRIIERETKAYMVQVLILEKNHAR